MGGLRFGPNPQEEDKCLNFAGTQTFQPANSYQSGGGNCACNSGFQYNGLSGDSASCNYVPQDVTVTVSFDQYRVGIECPSGKRIINTYNLQVEQTGACGPNAWLVDDSYQLSNFIGSTAVLGMSEGCPALVSGTIVCR
jgi:hypothetical protein